MAEESLVIRELNRDMIDAGEAFVSKLESEGFDATAILWLYMEHLGDWRVIIASPDVDHHGTKQVYLKARSILYGMDDDTVKDWLINKVMAVGEQRPPIHSLQKIAAIQGETALGKLEGVVDGTYINSYIYKIKPLELKTVKLALLSTYDKNGLVDFARQLTAGGYDLVSTGGTARDLQRGGLDVQQVSDLTGSPEILDGRVKTLHPKIHAGILARRGNEAHMAQLADDDTRTIDIVVCNLYPFVETVSRPDVTLDDALENIDIGGPTMIRAAAKNFPDVLVVVNPTDYEWIGERIAEGAEITLDERRELARAAFQHVALYDTAISRYLSGEETSTSWAEFTLGYNRVQDLRYGENPHQQATLYSTALSTGGIVDARRLHGLEMSFTNILDADAAWRVVSDFSENAVAVIKHTNPCGLAVHPDQAVAYQRAFEGDSISAYGGIVGFNRTVTAATAEAMRKVLYDQIIAPGYEPDALKILKRRRRTRILEVTPAHGPTEGLDVRTVSGGVLVQTTDNLEEDPATWKVATERAPTADELRDLAFAWRACKHIKSNTIVLAKDNTLVGMGAGQPNRVVSVHLSLRIAGDKARGSVLASDAFFPFPDSVEMAAEGGITAIAQPGGSIRDDESIEAANRLGIAMVLTGTRHFRH